MQCLFPCRRCRIDSGPQAAPNMHSGKHVDLSCIHDPVRTFRLIPERAQVAVAKLRAELAKDANSDNPLSTPQSRRSRGLRGPQSENMTFLLTRHIRHDSQTSRWRPPDDQLRRDIDEILATSVIPNVVSKAQSPSPQPVRPVDPCSSSHCCSWRTSLHDRHREFPRKAQKKSR